MPLHNGPIAVRFHGGFLDGHVSHSGAPQTGKVTDFWNAEAVFFATKGQPGKMMVGPSTQEWARRQSAGSGDTFSLKDGYRVTGWKLDAGTLVIDVAHEGLAD